MFPRHLQNYMPCHANTFLLEHPGTRFPGVFLFTLWSPGDFSVSWHAVDIMVTVHYSSAFIYLLCNYLIIHQFIEN